MEFMSVFAKWESIFVFQVVFQYTVRHSPLRIEELFASIGSFGEDGTVTRDVEMVGE